MKIVCFHNGFDISFISSGSALQKLYLSTEIFKMSHSQNYCAKPSTSSQRLGLQAGINNCLIIRSKVGAGIARRNKMRAAQLKSKEDREKTSLEKSTEAWQIMTTLVLLLIKFVRSFKINIKDNWWYDITKISTPLKKS